ncbi:thioredoxin-like protein [Sporormia fimetaria CBS 119925]|uniref:Thioredoxin-like protein n=1 Tax=Sporormia fimetaria CBS 119925 TaxID=1340428 RepID=A0A6A6UW98_9PLEO|nr:thioredoxin-like protein [Sporormia fimetaria CBS 119925]
MSTTAAQDEFNELMRDKGCESRHPEDRDRDSDAASEHDSDPNDYLEKVDTDDELDLPKDMRAAYYLPNIRSEANTGPKGVIADAHAFEQAKKQARRFTWRKASPTPNTSYTVNAWHDEKASSGDESGDEGFMRKWREERLRELQNAGNRIRSRTTSPSRRIYGSLTAVDGEGYLEAIEKVARDTVVVVFIYDDLSEISNTIEHYMRLVAQRNDSVRFVKLHYEVAEMEEAGVPAVLAYRNADKFAGLVPLVDEIPEDSEISAVALETVFRR